MNAHPAEQQHYPGLEPILSAIAHWITKYRQVHDARAEFRRCDSEEVARIARELNVSPRELGDLAGKGPESAALLGKMLLALGIDPESRPLKDPLLMRDLQRLCVACDHKRQCAHELAAGTAAEHYREFCPNAYTLDVLLGQRH